MYAETVPKILIGPEKLTLLQSRITSEGVSKQKQTGKFLVKRPPRRAVIYGKAFLRGGSTLDQ